MNKKIQLVLLSFILMILAACTAGPNTLMNSANSLGEIAGFWQGLWHGLIAIVTFIISLFKDTVSVYEVHNNGTWYNFGFILGMMIVLGGGGKGCCGKKKSWKEKEWEDIGVKVEEKVRTGIKSWLDESEYKDKDWEDIGKNIEDKIKRELQKWAEK
jgi:hypothetical protein